MTDNLSFRNNPKLKEPGAQMEFTTEMLIEMKKCKEDPLYFIENYFYIKTIDHGKQLLKLWPFQREFIKAIHENRFLSALMARQMGKSACTSAYICWFIIFNDSKDVGIVANKLRSAKRVLRAIKLGYEMIPKWLQRGVVEWNKESIALENDSIVMAASTNGEAVTGDSLALLYIDEVAKIDAKLWDEFYNGAYPVITSAKSSKVLMTSSAKGMNHFYYMHKAAKRSRKEGGSAYEAFEAGWQERPDRDEAWKEETIANTSQAQFDQEFENLFSGSSTTLINGNVLKDLRSGEIIKETPSVLVFHEPQIGHRYMISVDTSRGLIQDYSAFTVIDITFETHVVAARYRNNSISPTIGFPKIIKEYGEHYGNALVMFELNDLGEAAAEYLYNELDYENLVIIKQKGTTGAKGRRRLGIVMNKSSKPKGCQNLKSLIEGGKLIVNCPDTIAELNVFVETGVSYAAEVGFHDDLVMTLVGYAFYISTPEFQMNSEYNIADAVKEGTRLAIEDDQMEFPSVFIDDHTEDEDEYNSFEGLEKADLRDPEWAGF